jgi:MFS family permease
MSLNLTERWHVRALVRIACAIGIVALLLMAWSAIEPAALPIVVGMSVGQGLGVLAFGCYLLAILTDMARSSRNAPTSMAPPPPPRRSAAPKSDEPPKSA